MYVRIYAWTQIDAYISLGAGGQAYEKHSSWREYPNISDIIRRALERLDDGKPLTLLQVFTV
jgi:hypothetical protein